MLDALNMKKLLIALALLPAIACAQSSEPYRGPIIDVHLHAQTRESLAQPVPKASSGVSAGDEDRLIGLIRADVEATIGPGHGEPIVEAAARHRLHVGDPVGYVDEVVDDVQQFFHDTFVDTTWPACPHHPNHPLWFSDGWWRCERIQEPIARLGALSGLNQERQG